jgi:hypothetical protein
MTTGPSLQELWTMPLEELAARAVQPLGSVQGQILYDERAPAVYQARVTLESLRAQEESARGLIRATRWLVFATWGLVLVDIGLKFFPD